MTQLQKRVLSVLGVALVVIAGHIAYSHKQSELVAARAETELARAHADSVLDYAATLTGDVRLAEWRADMAEARADTAEAQAQAAERKLATSTARYTALAVPDTCKQLKAAADSAIADAAWTAESWRLAYNEKTEQTVQLTIAKDSSEAGRQRAEEALARLNTAAGKLQHASKPSLIARLTPKVGFGGAVGIDPQYRPNAVVGITLGWSFR